MDYESQQQQQLLAQHHQQQQDYQQQQQQQQPYDPTQPQPQPQPQPQQSYDYDPSQPYYASYPQPYPNSTSYPQQQHQYQQHQHQQQQQQPYGYYAPDYASAAAAYQQPAQVDPNNGQLAIETAQIQPQQNAYYAAQEQQLQQQQQQSYDVPPGLNPAAAAAVAALSQLTQFAGKMEAAERAMAGMQERQWQGNHEGFGHMMGQPPPVHHGHPNFRQPPVGRSPYRGGGRRGGGRVRGGRSSFGNRHPRTDGGAPPFRGRGRMGRGGGRRFPHPGPASASSFHSESAPSLEPASAPFPAPVPSQAPDRNRRPPQVAWCDLCRVDCNTQEILEQHKNGKRHKKNLEKFEKFQNYEKHLTESQPKLTEQLENGQGGEENKVSALENLPDATVPENLPKASSPENLPSAAAADENKRETEQQTELGEQSEISKVEEPTEAPARKPWARSFDDRRHAPKRKPMKFGRGGKRLRYSEVVSSVQTPKEEPKYCALCNVTCDTQAVFECHLAGKKHMTRVKQTQGQHGSYGPKGIHALYPPHAHPRGFIPQGHNQPPIHGEGQDAAGVHQGPPVVDCGDGQAQQVVTDPQPQQDSGLQGQSSTAEPKVPEVVVVETSDQGAVMVETGGKGTVLDDTSMGAKSDLIMKDLSSTCFEVSSTNHVVLPGLDFKVDEGSKNAE